MKTERERDRQTDRQTRELSGDAPTGLLKATFDSVQLGRESGQSRNRVVGPG